MAEYKFAIKNHRHCSHMFFLKKLIISIWEGGTTCTIVYVWSQFSPSPFCGFGGLNSCHQTCVAGAFICWTVMLAPTWFRRKIISSYREHLNRNHPKKPPGDNYIVHCFHSWQLKYMLKFIIHQLILCKVILELRYSTVPGSNKSK